MDDGNDTRTKLLTLLNVSHLKSTKRKLKENPAAVESFEVPKEKRIKLNQRRKVILIDSAAEKKIDEDKPAEFSESIEQAVIDKTEEQLAIAGENLDGKYHDVRSSKTYTHPFLFLDGPVQDATDPFILHFGAKSTHLSESSRKATDGGLWRRNPLKPRKIPRYDLTYAGVEQVLPEDYIEGDSRGENVSSESYKFFVRT